MPFTAKSKKTGKEYILHSRPTANGSTKLYYFAGEAKDNAEPELPAGYEVSENAVTGLPILKKKAV